MEIDKLTSLVCAVQQGDGQAADALYTQTHQGLYYYISKTVNDPELAQDLLQETFIEIYQTIGNLHEPAAFLKWSRQIAYHKCTAYARKTREITVDETEDGLTVFDTIEEERTEFIPDEALDKEDLKQTVNAMIAALPMEQRSAIMLRYFDEISVKEIAEIQGVSEGTVKSRLNYGRKALQKSVEEYEKKNGIKLHCAGAIPLLLWLFREYAVANNISLTATAGSGAYAATNAAASAAAEGVKAGAKVAGKLAAKKLIAGITAAAVVAGGATTAVLLQKEPEELPMAWYGYGMADYDAQNRRYDLTVEEMDDAHISGHLEMSYLYKIINETDFTGTGTEEDGIVSYTITYETPLVIGIFAHTYEGMTLEYSKEEDTFSFHGACNVDMNRAFPVSTRVLAENEHWSGLGEDSVEILNPKEHLFDIQIYRMTEDAVTGKLTVTGGGEVDHLTKFTGRGYLDEGVYRFEVMLETPRTDNSPLYDITADRFWLWYDPERDTLTVFSLGIYSATLKKGE
jgi:RNA polymerase sigma factor (sigma-70 family)